MANSLTNLGEQYMLMGNLTSSPTDGGMARLAAKLKLFDGVSSVPAKDGTGFVEVANGNGYVTGGVAITDSDWTFSVVDDVGQIQLDDQIWTASGGTIPNIGGAYLTDAGDNVLAWWERATVTLNAADTLTADDLTVRVS